MLRSYLSSAVRTGHDLKSGEGIARHPAYSLRSDSGEVNGLGDPESPVGEVVADFLPKSFATTFVPDPSSPDMSWMIWHLRVSC